MSSMYYIGTFKDNTVNKPIEITGITETCIENILKHCGIDVYEDFHYFTDNKWNLLFYKMIKENRCMVEYNDFIDDDFYKDEVDFEEFPINCNGKVLDSGNSYHIKSENIFVPNYSNFKKMNLTMELLDSILKDYSGWQNNKDMWFFEEINKVYKIIAKWIEDNQLIYWWKYC